jgi:acetolactate decarboxylase
MQKYFMRRVFSVVIVSFLMTCSPSVRNNLKPGIPVTGRETLFQVSTMQALLAGDFDGKITLGELKQHGDFGIGMIDGLDGEMVALNGQFFRAREDGHIFSVSDRITVAFAVVTFFDADHSVKVEKIPGDFLTIRKSISSLIPDKNAFYAIKIEGEFKTINTRSVPVQSKPHRGLLEVLKKDQKIQVLKNVKGTMVGFWFPVYSGGINVPRYHFHFLSRNQKRGGHVLDCSLRHGTIEIDHTPNIRIELLFPQDFD